MKPRVCAAVLATCLVTGLARSADPTLPPIIDYTATAPDAGRAGEQLALLHEWPGALVFGFVGQGRLLVYDSTRQAFEVHDLAAPDVPTRAWKNPDADRVVSGAFSPDRRTLATVHSAGNGDGRVQARQSRIRLWNIEAGELIERAFTPSEAGYVAFSPDGKSLFGTALDSSGEVTVWDVASGEIHQALSLPPPQPHLSYSGVHFSPTGRHLAARLHFGGAYSLWEVEIWKPAVESAQPVLCMAISPDWKTALAADIPAGLGPANIRLVGLADPGTQVKAPTPLPAGTEKTLTAGAFSPDGRRLAYSHLNGAVRLWEIVPGRVESTLAVNAGTVMRMGFSPDGQRLMTYGLPPGRSPGEVQLWGVAARRPLGLPESLPGIFWDFQFDPDSRYLVVSFLPGDDRIHAKVWRLPARDEPPGAPQSPPNADSIDVREVGFKTPECVVWDKVADVYLVSNIHGHPLDKDDNGFISRVRPDGTVEALQWIDGATEGVTLHAPKGMAIVRDSLWVADIDVVRQFDLHSGKPLGEIAVEGATFLNDVAFAGEREGTHLLVTDTGMGRDGAADLKPNGKPRLVTIDTADRKIEVRSMAGLKGTFRQVSSSNAFGPGTIATPGGGPRSFSPDEGYGQPNGIAFLGAGYAMVTWDTGCLYVLTPHDQGGATHVYQLPKGQLDGVVSMFWEQRMPADPMQRRGRSRSFLVSSREGRCVYELGGGRVTELVSDVRAPADLGYDAKRNRVLIPLYLDDALLIRPGPRMEAP